MIYRCTFDRISRDHNVGAQEFSADDAQGLAEALYNFVRQHCLSRDVEVVTNLEEGKGRVIVGGFRPAGEFTIEQVV